MQKAARVLIDGPSDLVFDYAIPDGVAVASGCRVKVPLRNRAATGTVLAVNDVDQQDFALRELSSLIDPEPLVTPQLMKLGRWIADYYAAPMEQVMRSLLPESVRQESNSQKTQKLVKLKERPEGEAAEKLAKRAPKQHFILNLLQSKGGELLLKELGSGAGSSVKSLEKNGWVVVEEQAIRRNPDDGVDFVPSKPLQLNDEQRVAYEVIVETIQGTRAKPILLHGVTGSGKTEVYLQAVQKALDLGKSAIILVPEISLTPQTVQRFKARFAHLKDQVAVMHSHLSQGERFDEWHRIRKGDAKIVIGARSAVFAPLTNLGVIIVDEEHENTYKQENPPRYNGRDVAVLRAHVEECAVVLGSATPALESYANTQKQKYELVSLEKRVDGQSLPLVRLIDMRLESRKRKGAMTILSDSLRAAIDKKISDGEQVILFLNRRGFARSLQCPDCGHVCECTHCSVPLTYHRSDERLICHICGHQAIVPKACPKCHDPAIRLQGYGTEKVEQVMSKVFPNASIARIDADAMRKKNALRETLAKFQAKKIDILIGTQMIAKGLHFPNVTLVGILNADVGLHIPDFRAGERTFQLITQVAGRAGRGEMEGEVYVQTFTPHSPSIQFGRQHDFDGFAEQEMGFRKQFFYPPYAHVALLTAKSSHERRAEFTLQTLHLRLKELNLSELMMGEVLPSPLVKTHGQFRFQLMLRASNARMIARAIKMVLEKTSLPDDVTVVIDIDAQSLS